MEARDGKGQDVIKKGRCGEERMRFREKRTG
jgi:hypothetical protein